MRADSKVGLGTAITIYLPVYAGAKVDAPETSKREARQQTEISRFIANSPELAGFRVRILLCNLSTGFQGLFRRAFVSAPPNRVSPTSRRFRRAAEV